MFIQRIGGLYIVKGHYDGVFMTASGSNLQDLLAKLFSEIAIYRSLKAWNK